MFHTPRSRGAAARDRAGAGMPWLVEVCFAVTGLDAVGDLLGLLLEGAGSAARDAAWDAGAGAACELVAPLALALGLHDLPLGSADANLVAVLAKVWAGPVAGAVTYLLLATTNAAVANSVNSSAQYSPIMNRSNRVVAAGSALRLRRYCMRWWMLPCSQLCSDSTTPSTV
jgi:hypothetical protein